MRVVSYYSQKIKHSAKKYVNVISKLNVRRKIDLFRLWADVLKNCENIQNFQSTH